jgi:predicted enzyme related to lactoylglutathione lyase
VAALRSRQNEQTPAAWTVHLATADATSSVALIEAAGGTMIVNPAPVGERGVTALAVDPEGAVFGLWQSGTHQGFQQTRQPGSFTWTEVHVRDTARADAFYDDVFGYTTSDAGPDLRLWAPAGAEFGPDTAFGGRKLLSHEGPAYFEAFFAVADADIAAERAEQLGGKVIQAPFDTPFGRLAVLADNQGAAFMVEARP